MNYLDRTLLRQTELARLIEAACRSLEIPQGHAQLARQRYESLGEWLAGSDDPLLASIAIRLQGSMAIGTTVKPLGGSEFDVDLVAHVTDLDVRVPPASLKRSIGDRFRSHASYRAMLEEKSRCWRLNYANHTHFDITPSIPNPSCANGGELVPDKELKNWKPTNPQGYRAKFDRRAALLPRLRRALRKAVALDEASIEPFPDNPPLKGLLRRIVQIAKRHRDLHFLDEDPSLAPLSVIVTTIASRAYEHCVRSFEYENELELVWDVIRKMPAMLEIGQVDGRQVWQLWNMTTAGENFCEKWNREPKRAAAFFAWHAKLLQDLERLAEAKGLDAIRRQLAAVFGDAPASRALDAITESVSEARTANRLHLSKPAGLIAGAGVGITSVRANTFFGR
jgi:hypothetical protein